MIACHHGVTAFPSAQRDMHVNDIVMSTCRAHEANASGNVQVHDRDLGIKREDETREMNLLRAAPSLSYDPSGDTQCSSAIP
jgi:hypothetical protein